jgi:hypothetical protein
MKIQKCRPLLYIPPFKSPALGESCGSETHQSPTAIGLQRKFTPARFHQSRTFHGTIKALCGAACADRPACIPKFRTHAVWANRRSSIRSATISVMNFTMCSWCNWMRLNCRVRRPSRSRCKSGVRRELLVRQMRFAEQGKQELAFTFIQKRTSGLRRVQADTNRSDDWSRTATILHAMKSVGHGISCVEQIGQLQRRFGGMGQSPAVGAGRVPWSPGLDSTRGLTPAWRELLNYFAGQGVVPP